MKEIAFSVPSDTFPSEVGERVRMSLTNLNGLEMLDGVVLSLDEGCGVSDRVVIEYDETVLPGSVQALSRCNLAGFQELCDCCSARICTEVFAPTAEVEEGTWYAMLLPTDFKLEKVKIYSPGPSADAITVQVQINGEDLFPIPIVFDGNPATINRVGFASAFASGELPPESVVEVVISDETDWNGLTLCLLGNWLP